ncbi:hypothetical protein ACTQ4K_00010 [Clostridium sporogenes]|uniref:hypothetical protein n=1 Tax=Clostridium sporogenes TaxID=1509 RepID=UPI003F90FE5D
MSKETTNLKLFKYDKETDNFNTTTFNIKQCLNDNWDKLDSQMAENTKRIETVQTTANNAMPKSGGDFTGIVKAYSNTSYSVAQARNIILSSSDANVNLMKDGEIWIKYK